MIGFILTCLVILSVSMVVAGIPLVILYILLEMKGLGSYVLALAVLIASLIELIKFISYIAFGTDVPYSFKDLLNKVKSLFNKEKKNQNKVICKVKNKSITINTIEVLVILAFAIYAIFFQFHGLLISIIYKNIITRILSIIFFPLVICNIINEYREDWDGFFGLVFLNLFAPLLAGAAIGTTIMFTADVWHPEISKSIQSWFIFDDRRFDEIRKNEEFKGEFEYLKSSYEKTYNELIKTCDINEPACLERISTNLFRNTNIKEYGYTITNSYRYSDEIELICVLDKKTKKYNFYKITLKDFSFELSSQEEYEKLLKEKK